MGDGGPIAASMNANASTAGAVRRRSSAARPAPSIATTIASIRNSASAVDKQHAAQIARFGVGVAGVPCAQA